MIRIVVTGGTFDKTYDEIGGAAEVRRDPFVRDAAAGALPRPASIRTLMMIDSLETRDADRALIARNCGSARSRAS